MVISMNRLLAAAALLAVAAAARAGEKAPAAGAASAAVADVKAGVVDGATARKLVASGVKIVDVRTPAEFAAGHVPGAVNIPYDEMAARHAEIGPPSAPVLLYCRTGNRSAIAAGTLRERGFSTIYDLQAYDRWVASEPKR
jgi:rhodanese-related sulfurtransferase